MMAMYTTQANGLGADIGTGTGTINPAALNSASVANPPSNITPDTSPRGVKRSRSPDTYGDQPTGDGGDDDNSKPRKRGRPMKTRTSGGIPESPSQSSMSHPSQSMPPQTPQQQNAGLPPPVNAVTPTQASPPKTTPTKNVVKALPTVRDHTTDQLGPEGDEYVPREYDDAGEQKVESNGQLRDGRRYRCRTFLVPNRGDKLFMLATECARVLGYRDSYLLFNKNRSLYKIIATQTEKEDLIHQEILPFSYRSRQIAIVTAKSMFRQFGSRVIAGGRRVRDDYWESKARKQGFTEDDLAGEKRPGAAKARDAAAAEASATASAMLGHHGDIVYTNTPGHFGHQQPQTVQPGMMGGPGAGTPLPMITLAPDQNDLRFGDFRNMPRPRHEIQGSAYIDRTQPSSATELLTQAHHAADYSKSLNQQRGVRGKYMETFWKQSQEALASSVAGQPSSSGEHLPAVTQPLEPPHSSTINIQQPIQSSPSQHMITGQSYTQPTHQQSTVAQSPMRGLTQSSMRPEQMPGRSPSLPHTSGGIGQSANPYGFVQQNQMWAASQPPQPSQHGFTNYGPQQSSHLQQSPHQPPPSLRHSSSNPQMQPGMQYPGIQGMQQAYPTPRQGLYQSDQTSPQYMPQNTAGSQPSSQNWSPQHAPGQGNWAWGNQG